MRRLRIVLDFAAYETAPRANDELRGYLKTMVQQQNFGIGLGSRALESLGLAGTRLLEATWQEVPRAAEVASRSVAPAGRYRLPRDSEAPASPARGLEGGDIRSEFSHGIIHM
jgi:hypothetical protein